MFQQFFSDKPGFFHFQLFGSIHITITLLLLIGIFLIHYHQEKLKRWKYKDKMRYIMAGILFVNMSIFYIDQMVRGVWSLLYSLPLHFCFISGYLFMLCLVLNKRKWFRVIYYFSFIGPLPAIIFPDLICGMDRFIFWQFVISHHIFILFSVYTNKILDWKVELKDIKSTMFYANLIFVCVFVFNLIFKTNYIMTDTLPDHILTLFPFVTWINFPILWLELAGFIACGIACLPLIWKNPHH